MNAPHDFRFKRNTMLKRTISLSLLITASTVWSNSAIFLHPDGTGLGHWNAARLLIAGPDGMTNWDNLEVLSAYRPHQKNWLTSTSHAGATAHAYGKKVHYDSFGMDRDQPLTSLSGQSMTILQEAMSKGLRTGTVNSGHIAEPGTAVFATSNESRKNTLEIAQSVMESGLDLMFSGGETFLLPEGEIGFFGEPGLRTDGRNLIEEAKSNGYKVIFTREELLLLPDNTDKVIGIFAPGHTFNDNIEEEVQQKGIPLYRTDAPTIAEMTAAALRILGSDPETDFFVVIEEEGTDNFSNKTNAAGMLEATIRADEAIGVASKFLESHPERPTLLLVAADSDAGHPTVFAPRNTPITTDLPSQDPIGSPIDGTNGSGGTPFVSLPDQFGNRYPFGIAWATAYDMPGSVVAKASGYGSDRIGSTMDNTGPYKVIYSVLFEEEDQN